MTGCRIFIESNIWVYVFGEEDDKKAYLAKKFIDENWENKIFISYQVVNEVSNVLKRKRNSETKIKTVINNLSKNYTVLQYSTQNALLASDLREKYKFSFWDSNIAASALSAKCDYLISEDMQDGLNINGMTVKNILK